MTGRDYYRPEMTDEAALHDIRQLMTDEAALLYDIRQLMAMMLVGSFAEPEAISAIADRRIREVMEEARADLQAVGQASQAQFKKRLHNGRVPGA